ncbi:MAG: exonuclease domain-containing protein [Bacteroidales bacterium]|nr:exonuclease domain-containing protein [Bacteroidales bacterium]
MFAILDIETTGGSPKTEKITEIAIYFHDGEKIVDEWSTLINPEKSIPYFITGLTGITNEMVANAPRFCEIAKELVERTENHTIVGHNVKFDYSFIQSEFRNLGFSFDRNTLCTIKLSRKIIPGHKSYSLGKLCRDLGIEITDRHRAEGDALATVKLFELLRDKQNGEFESALVQDPSGKYKNLNEHLTVEDIQNLPEACGTYYFFDEHKELLYIGKSKDIRHRVLSHLGNTTSRRAMEMKQRIHSISYELTGSELIALLKESREIKEQKPRFNRAQKRSSSYWGLYPGKDESGYITFSLKKISETADDPVTCFNNQKEAREVLTKMVGKHWLCQKLSGLYQTNGACFHHSIRQCNGACIQAEAVSAYNKRAGLLLDSLTLDRGNVLIIDKGRDPDERSLVRIEKGIYMGYGYLSVNEAYLGIEEMLDCIQPSLDNRDIRQILRNWLKNNQVEKLLYY